MAHDADDDTELLKRIVSLELTLMTLWDMFTHAPRGGEEQDSPEGARYIQISDTMANDVIFAIDNLLGKNRVSAVDLRTKIDGETTH